MPKICDFENCRKRASYGYTNGSLERCKEHKEDRPNALMVCKCGKARPSYNDPGKKVAVCCVSCKTETMVNVMHKKCICGKARPSFNDPGKKVAVYCSSCKTETMVNVIDKKCKCGLHIPNYNEPGKTTPICCSSCKTDTMINVKNKKCKCGLHRPTYNESGKKVAVCCVSCKTESMVNIINKKCKLENCPIHANPKYKGYCANCFIHLFPNDPLTFQARCKTKELAVRDYINQNFQGFICDKQLTTANCDCTIRRRPDLRILINETLLCVEIDENQHKSYNEMDEETRYNDLYMAYSGKWIYIRFNPDKYKKNDRNVNPTIAKRLIILKKEIEKQIKRIENEENEELVERIYLYFDNYK
tara:strand:- start:188 stop:1267 length:1080 start_codon:yes stop_codon:yes gene_type:complete